MEFLPLLVPVAVYALIGIISLFLYFYIRKAGFVVMGIGFLISVFPGLVRLLLGGPYLPVLLHQRGLSAIEIAQFLLVLSLVDLSITVVFALLVLIGLILFVRDLKTKQ